MSKMQRTYEMTVEGSDGKLHKFDYPLTVIFSTTKRATGSGSNTGHFMLYNLSESSRSAIEFDLSYTPNNRRVFEFRAGYISDGYKPVIFQGSIKKALSYREHADVVTDIEVTDGLVAKEQAQIQSSRAYPWSPTREVERLVETMGEHGVKLGAIGSLFKDHKSTRGVMWLGSTWDVLKNLARSVNGYAYINNEKVYLLGPNDYLSSPGQIGTLDASTGLLETPRRSGITVDARMIFEPRADLNQKITVASTVSPNLNGTYKIFGVSHSGIISGAKDGGVITSLSLQLAEKELTKVIVK